MAISFTPIVPALSDIHRMSHPVHLVDSHLCGDTEKISLEGSSLLFNQWVSPFRATEVFLSKIYILN